jgi:hypothetical protein
MKLLAICVFCFFAYGGSAWADEAAQCDANGGTYVTGTVTKAPTFAHGHQHRGGVELSRTHLMIQSDQDRQSYDVVMENVFATGYDGAGESVPAPLSTIRIGDRLGICGKVYQGGGRGIDWVHTNCGAKPSTAQPSGWLKVMGADGSLGPNVQGSQEYCSLWQ